MPELPEVEVTRKALAAKLLGASFKRVVKKPVRLRKPLPSKSQFACIVDKKILQFSRHGKYLFVEGKGFALVVHLGMSGIVSIDTPPRRHDHCRFTLRKGQRERTLAYNDPRRFGLIAIHDSVEQFVAEKKLGVDALNTKRATARYLYSHSRKRACTIKSFLMNQSILAGVGNIYASESLFLAKIHPQKQAGSLTMQQYASLIVAVRKVLRCAIEAGGSTLQNFSSPDGSAGYFTVSHQVYDREHQPCVDCSTEICKIIQQNRSSFYCPSCQLLDSKFYVIKQAGTRKTHGNKNDIRTGG